MRDDSIDLKARRTLIKLTGDAGLRAPRSGELVADDDRLPGFYWSKDVLRDQFPKGTLIEILPDAVRVWSGNGHAEIQFAI